MRINRIKFTTILAQRDLTVTQLSALTGISRPTLSSIKQGKRCRPETAEKIAAALNTDVSQLIEG